MRSIAEVMNSPMPESGIGYGIAATRDNYGPPPLRPRLRPYRQQNLMNPLTEDSSPTSTRPLRDPRGHAERARLEQPRPSSARSGPVSHRPRAMPSTPRSASGGIPRPCRPPTPEYRIPQDCAFPPFPGFNQGFRPQMSPPDTPTRSAVTSRAPTPTRLRSSSSAAEVTKASRPKAGFFRRLFSSPEKPTKKLTKSTSQLDLAMELAALAGLEVGSQTRSKIPGTQSSSATSETVQVAMPDSISQNDNAEASNNTAQVQASSSDAEPVETSSVPSLEGSDPPATPLKSALRLQTHELPQIAPEVPTRSPLRAPSVKKAHQSRPHNIEPIALPDGNLASRNSSQCLPQLVLPPSPMDDVFEVQPSTSSGDHSSSRSSSRSPPPSRSSSREDRQGSVSTACTSPETSPNLSKDDFLPISTASQNTTGISMTDLAASLRDLRALSVLEPPDHPLVELSLPPPPSSPSAPHAPSVSPSKVSPSKATTGLLARPPLTTRLTSTSRTPCRGCSTPIIGRAIKAADGRLTGRYHKACFVCNTCAEPLASTCYVLDDRPYCARHYHEANGSLCRGCGRGIEGRYLEMEGEVEGDGEMRMEVDAREGRNGRMWHLECFGCVECGEELREKYWEVQGHVYCERDAERIVEGLDGTEKMERRQTRLLEI